MPGAVQGAVCLCDLIYSWLLVWVDWSTLVYLPSPQCLRLKKFGDNLNLQGFCDDDTVSREIRREERW